METLVITSADGLTSASVALNTPTCELRWDGCTTIAVAGLRVHDCRFYYTCANCRGAMYRRVETAFRRFREMQCKNCGLEFTQGNYFEIISLE